MDKRTRNIIIAVLVIALLAAGAFFCWKVFSPGAQAGDKHLEITVTHADGTVKSFDLNTDAEYLWDALYTTRLVDGTDSEYGKWVTTVDGETADEANGQYWTYTKSGEWVMTSIDTTPIADGESYEFSIYAG